MAHAAQGHTFTRCQGTTLLRKLPEEARQSLRYYETVGLLSDFKPFAPLSASVPVVRGKRYFYVAITDWSLFLLTADNKVEGAVVLELPWLGTKQLVRGVGEAGWHASMPSSRCGSQPAPHIPGSRGVRKC